MPRHDRGASSRRASSAKRLCTGAFTSTSMESSAWSRRSTSAPWRCPPAGGSNGETSAVDATTPRGHEATRPRGHEADSNRRSDGCVIESTNIDRRAAGDGAGPTTGLAMDAREETVLDSECGQTHPRARGRLLHGHQCGALPRCRRAPRLAPPARREGAVLRRRLWPHRRAACGDLRPCRARSAGERRPSGAAEGDRPARSSGRDHGRA